MDFDVVVLGGGPAGSTLAGFLRKYNPALRVLVLEREVFPRDHVGESQLPPITRVLQELGAWEKVEAAGFPVKTGALYRWGVSNDLWKFDFLNGEEFIANPRPEPLQGQRLQTTFHVDRAQYDQILLDHARELGAEVREGVKATSVAFEGDRITAIRLASGDEITARTYIDATGHTGFLRRNLGVGVTEPSGLRNIAIWDYYQDPAWANTIAANGVRVRVLSLGYGWIWFIPIRDDTVSVGVVTHADFFKASGLKPAEFFQRAVQDEPHVSRLMANATSLGRLASTKDWSFVADRAYGENWFLVGESLGFADPILAAGMSLAQVGARELAYLILAEERGDYDSQWLREWYASTQLKRISQHIKFADYWYRANAHFTKLKEFMASMAAEEGMSLSPDEAFRWLAAGGFTNDDLTAPIVGTYTVGSAKAAMGLMTGEDFTFALNQYNEFRLNLVGAVQAEVPFCQNGRIELVKCWRRGDRTLPLIGVYELLVSALNRERDAANLARMLQQALVPRAKSNADYWSMTNVLDALESLIVDGWVKTGRQKNRPTLEVTFDASSVVPVSSEDPFADVPMLATGRV